MGEQAIQTRFLVKEGPDSEKTGSAAHKGTKKERCCMTKKRGEHKIRGVGSSTTATKRENRQGDFQKLRKKNRTKKAQREKREYMRLEKRDSSKCCPSQVEKMKLQERASLRASTCKGYTVNTKLKKSRDK